MMLKSNAPIGVYDSGVGGLTVWSVLREITAERVIYYGDTAHLPYGEKTKEQIMHYSSEIIRFFLAKNVKAIIAACNTSSAAAVPTLRGRISVPLFGVIEPAVKRALEVTVNGKIGVLATNGTVRSGAYQQSITSSSSQAVAVAQGCPKLVPLIEAGLSDGPEVEEACLEYLVPLLEKGVDTVILGCTHYPFLLPVLRRISGAEIRFVDPAEQTVFDVQNWLRQNELLAEPAQELDEFWVSGNPWDFAVRAAQFTGKSFPNVKVHSQVEYGDSAVPSLPKWSPLWRGNIDE